jgi:hypothetical protein
MVDCKYGSNVSINNWRHRDKQFCDTKMIADGSRNHGEKQSELFVGLAETGAEFIPPDSLVKRGIQLTTLLPRGKEHATEKSRLSPAATL